MADTEVLKLLFFLFQGVKSLNCIALNEIFASSVFFSNEVTKKKKIGLAVSTPEFQHRAILSTTEVQHICLSFFFFSLALQLQGNTVMLTRVKWPPNHNVAYQSR